MNNLPQKIYLQIDADGETPEDFNELGGVTWCYDKIHGNDIEYVLSPSHTEQELRQKCESDHLSINELLAEFKRQGFDTSNWDGEEGAEKAIVDGVRSHVVQLDELYDKALDISVGDLMEARIKRNQEVQELRQEIERLKWLIEKTFKAQEEMNLDITEPKENVEINWQKFKYTHNL